MKAGKDFFDRYITSGGVIVDIGSKNVNGSLRSVASVDCKYLGLDCETGDGVDVVMSDPYKIPYPNDFADFCVSTSCFEHVDFFWELFLEMVRIVKPGGFIYINAPSAGPYHCHPVDCWRFYPDAGDALKRWAERNGLYVTIVDTYTLDTGAWNDWVAIFRKEVSNE